MNRLIAAKADVHRANHKGITPLFTACRHGHEACARAVLAEGASVDARSNGGLTAMQNAAARGHLSCVQLLSAHSADRGGNAPQRYAAHFGHHHIVTWLQRSQFWTTPLHHADIIDRKTAYDLLRGGASISVRAREVMAPSPLDVAREVLGRGEVGGRIEVAKAAPLASLDTAAALIVRAAAPWSPETHPLFPEVVRGRAYELLKLGYLLSRQSRFSSEAGSLVDAWRTFVMPHALPRDWKPPKPSNTRPAPPADGAEGAPRRRSRRQSGLGV